MGKKEIIDIIRQNRPEIENRYGVERLGLFGSFVRGQAGRCSDIEAKYWLEPDVELARNHRLSWVELREIEQIIEAHRDELKSAWQIHFGS